MRGIPYLIVLLSIAILAGCSRPSSDIQQKPADLDLFVGAWHLVDWTVIVGDGTTTHPYGEQAQGQIVYASSGQMSAQLMRPDADVTRFADLDGASALEQLGLTTFFAYWGTYEVDDTAKTVTHHVEGSLAPTWVGTAQVRGYRFEGQDRLILTARLADTKDATGVDQLMWKRIR